MIAWWVHKSMEDCARRVFAGYRDVDTVARNNSFATGICRSPYASPKHHCAWIGWPNDLFRTTTVVIWREFLILELFDVVAPILLTIRMKNNFLFSSYSIVVAPILLTILTNEKYYCLVCSPFLIR